jgi:hypothetical protein
MSNVETLIQTISFDIVNNRRSVGLMDILGIKGIPSIIH